MAYGKSVIAVLTAMVVTAPAVVVPALAGKSDDTMVVAFQRGIRSIDRLYTTAREGLILSELTDDSLVILDPETARYIPLAAKSYQFVDDKTLEFQIRDSIKFHDGSPLTADDVVYTVNWVLDRSSGTNRTRQFRKWLRNVEKTGPMAVRFNLKFPYPLALRDIAVSIQLRKKGAYDGPKDNAKVDQGAPILNGIGPYKVVAFESSMRVVVERFDDYYKDSP
jgi:peptide/nickel transport system substrate-binding protein